MKNILILTILVLTTSLAFAQSETVMIKSVETYGGFSAIERGIYITEGDSDTKTVSDLEKHNKNGIPKNMRTLKIYLDQYLDEGYRIISSTATSFGENGVYTVESTYLLQRDSDE
tara:strand:+ start:2809 stop:3153 length:345 start_codon:yes stop_codon:yes gene_type:complete